MSAFRSTLVAIVDLLPLARRIMDAGAPILRTGAEYVPSDGMAIRHGTETRAGARGPVAAYVARGVAVSPIVVAARRAPGSGTSTAAATSTSRAGSAARTRVTASQRRRGDPRAGRPVPPPVLHGRRPTSRTSRSAAGSPSSRRAAGRSSAASSSTPAPRRSRTRSRSRASATGRPAVVVFDYAFHGRTLLAMTMTSKVVPYKLGFGPFAPEVYRAAGPVPVPRVDTDAAVSALEHLFKADVDPATRRLRRPRDGSGRGRVHSDAGRLPLSGSPRSAASTGSSTSRTRCSRGSAGRARSGRSSTRGSSRTSSSPASPSAAAFRWPA